MAHVLIVEDNPIHQRLFGAMLGATEHTWTQVATAGEALQALSVRAFDLLIADIMLPGRSGSDLARLVRADPRTQQMPILCVSAFGLRGDETRLKAAGCTEYLPRPFTRRQLLDAVARLLAAPAPERETPMNIWNTLAHLPQAVAAVKDLAARLIALHDDPEFQALIASNANIKAQSDAISRDARDISNAFK